MGQALQKSKNTKFNRFEANKEIQMFICQKIRVPSFNFVKGRAGFYGYFVIYVKSLGFVN